MLQSASQTKTINQSNNEWIQGEEGKLHGRGNETWRSWLEVVRKKNQ